MLKIETATTREDRHREQMDRLLSRKMFLQVNAVVSIKYIFKLIKRKLIQMKIKFNAICWYFTTFQWFAPERSVLSGWTQKTFDRVVNELSNGMQMNGTTIKTTGAGIFEIFGSSQVERCVSQ